MTMRCDKCNIERDEIYYYWNKTMFKYHTTCCLCKFLPKYNIMFNEKKNIRYKALNIKDRNYINLIFNLKKYNDVDIFKIKSIALKVFNTETRCLNPLIETEFLLLKLKRLYDRFPLKEKP